ncbi:MAG: UDP-N-acetylmuramate:L-alanyl-gamma-D-glutamyl-meso-diaminopimelate ligase [Pseudomonadales bacterium]
MHIHVLGACGTLMGSIALLAKAMGHQVTGSDEQVYPPMSTQLEEACIPLQSPYSEKSIPSTADLVILGNAGLGRGNAAVEALLRSRKPFCSGAEFLGRNVLQGQWVLAVSGTHGKTTTASMLAFILIEAGLEPGYLIGGVPLGLGPSAQLGGGTFFVIEADEYDTSYFDRRAKFQHYAPQTLIINNLEFDHADIYPDLASIQKQFHQLVRLVPDHGLIIRPSLDQAIDEVLGMGCWTPCLNFALGEDPGQTDLKAHLLRSDASRFEVSDSNRNYGEVQWQLTGRHNAKNALAAIAAARHAGVPIPVAIDALSKFQGVKRRMELICETEHLKVYDDFAHHPTAIKTTLSGLRAKVGREPIIAVVELGSYTMRQGEHARTLGSSVSEADQVIWFIPRDVHFDTESLSLVPHSVIIRSAGALMDFIDRERHQESPMTHLLLMSNYRLDGFRELVTERYG